MDNTAQKRRGGRPSKVNTQQQQQSSDTSSTTSTENTDNISKNVETTSPREEPQNANIMDAALNIIDGSAISISPTSDSPIDSALAGNSGAAAECRRSSRKKIIKFDVRDLLNKNRKPHKIQIEARIDSNAPTSSAMPAGPGSTSLVTTAGAGGNISATSTADLTSKQKTFIEKSAIFRRYSISEQQNKINAPPRPPLPPPVSKISLLNKSIDSAGSESAGSGGDNLSAPVHAVLDPIKMAQARRLSRTQEIFNASMMKSKQNSSLIVAQMESSSSSSRPISTPMISGKRKLVGAKTLPLASMSSKRNLKNPTSFGAAHAIKESTTQKRRGRPPKNKTMEKAQELEKTTLAKNADLVGGQKSTSTELMVTKLTPEKATNWKEYKECLKAKEKCVVESGKPSEPRGSVNANDVILEISSSSESELEELHSPTSESSSSIKDANQSPTKQRNFAAVSFMQDTPLTVNDNKTAAPEFIVAAVEEILTDCPVAMDSYESTASLTESKCDEISELSSFPVKTTSTNTTILATEDVQIMQRKVASRTSSGSESETNSDRSNKSYKLRVSLKRLSAQELSPSKDNTQIVPSSPTTSICSTTSSTRNSFSENSATSSKDTGEVQVKQTKKRSKRLQMKSEQTSVTSTSTASEAENEEKTTKIRSDFLPVVLKRTREQTKTKKVPKVTQIANESSEKTKNITLLDEEKNLVGSTSKGNDKTINEDMSKEPTHILDEIPPVDEPEAKIDITNTTEEVVGQNTPVIAIEDLKDKNAISETITTKPLEENKTSSLESISTPNAVGGVGETNKSVNTAMLGKPNIEIPSSAVGTSVDDKGEKTTKPLTKQTNADDLNLVPDENKLLLLKKSDTETEKLKVSGVITEISVELDQTKEKSKTSPKTQKEKILDGTNNDQRASLPTLVEEKKVAAPKKQKIEKKENLSAFKTEDDATTVEEEKATTSKKKDAKTETVLQEEAKTTIVLKEPLEESEINATSEIATATKTDVEETTQDSPPKLENISKITEQVIVETKTLLDILKTVQTNEKAAADAASVEIGEKPSTPKIAATKKRNSPTRSDTSSPQEVKKPIRRYERRSKRGDEVTHKTLEETFAEIAAQSSKEILEMAAALEIQREENVELEEEPKNNNTVEETELIESSLLTLNDKPEAERTINLDNKISINENVELAGIEETHTDSKEKSINIVDSNAQEADVSKTNVLETAKGPTEEVLEFKNSAEIISKEISEENIAETKSESEAKELNVEIANVSNNITQEKPQDDNKIGSRTPAKRGRKPKVKQNETTAVIESIDAEPQKLLQSSKNIDNNTGELEKPSEIEKQQKTFEAKSLEGSGIQKGIKKSCKPEKDIQTKSVSQEQAPGNRIEENLKLEDAQVTTPITTIEKSFDTSEMAEESSKQYNVQIECGPNQGGEVSVVSNNKTTTEENINALDIQSNIKKTKKSEKLLKTKEEIKVTETLESNEVKLKSLDKLKEHEISPKSVDTHELKEMSGKEEATNNQKKSKKSEKAAKTTEGKVIEKLLDTTEKKSLDKALGVDVNIQLAEADKLKETSEKLKAVKKSKKFENTTKTKDDTKANENLDSCEISTPKQKKPGKIFKQEESKINENSKDSQETSSKKPETETTSKSNETKATDMILKDIGGLFDVAKKSDLVLKTPTDSVDIILNEITKLVDKAESTPKQPPKKRLFKTKSDTEIIKNNPVETLTTFPDASQTKEIKESTKKAKKSPKFKDNTLKIKTKAAKNAIKPEEDPSPILESNNTPPKRVGKYKQKQAEVEVEIIASTSSEKKKGKKSLEHTLKGNKSSPKSLEKKNEKDSAKKLEKKKFLENENMADKACKVIEEKTSKKKRQKKLKEAFEAALNEEIGGHTVLKKDEFSNKSEFPEPEPEPVGNANLNLEIKTSENHSPSPPLYNLPLTPVNLELNSPNALEQESPTQPKEISQPTVIQPEEEDPDPLKDIEKFIEDGVNLLKRGYKIEDDDSVDEVLRAPSKSIKEDLSNKLILAKTNDADDKFNNSRKETNDLPSVLSEITSFADTPADTPLATPTASPSKSPVPTDTTDDSFTSGVRRSHRIKQIKTPTALVGRGLVRDKERFSLKDDMETKSHYTIDDHRMDLAEVEAKNAKFLKDMEERLSNFLLIKENEYKCERIVSREARKMICDCFLTAEEEGRGELACGEDCLNRLLMIECGPDCNVKERCTNKRFQKFLCSPCRVFRTEKKGFGIMADIEILPGEFIMEYVGEVINGEEFENRRIMYSQDKNRHYYFMALRSDAIIDATSKGNISRFINHSCDPNAETQKWTVNGELRIGFFSRKSIMPGEEITFDYQYQRYGREAQRCYCESANCRGWIGEEPTSDEGEQIDDESDEENLAESLLDEDDEDDSDETEDAEEAQKKLEIAAAEAKVLPITDEDKKEIEKKIISDEEQKREPVTDSTIETDVQKENEEDSKSKFKKLLSKMAEKVAKKREQKERKQRKQRAANADGTPHVKPRYLEDPDIEDEVHFLSRCGLKNQSDTLRLSRLMVRAKLVQTRLNLLKILRTGDLPCRRLFLDYHGMRLLHGWMSEDGGDLKIRMALLETLETLPIVNKTVLTDSKVFQTVRNWCAGITSNSGDNSLSPSDESSKESSSSSTNTPSATPQEVPGELQKLVTKLTAAWDSLPEIFRIPKKERIEQMKEHEREADRQYAAIAAQEEESRRNTAFPDRYRRDRFGRGPQGSNYANRFAWARGGGGVGGVKDQRNITALNTTSTNDPRRRSGNEIATQQTADNTKHLSKEQRREMFAAKVARDEAEKRLAEERREFETKCRFFGLDPKKTRPQNLPFCVNPTTGQWYSAERQPIPTPPTYAHVQVPVKPKSTNPADYQLPSCATNLSHKWKFAITAEGKIYYYHVQFRVPQWEPPTVEQMYGNLGPGGTDTNASNSDTDKDINDSTDDDDEIIKGMDATKLQAYIEKKIETRRQQRYGRLVDERPISPRREEDRIYNQIEVRKYKENKEKIRKRKEEIRRKRVEAVKNSTLNMCTLGSLEEPSASEVFHKVHGRDDGNGISNALPIQDYLLSSDEEEMMKAECNNSPLLDKIVQGDKIVDELDALTTKRTLKRPLPPHRDLSVSVLSSSASTSSGISSGSSDKHEHKKRKLDKRESSKSGKKSKDHDSKYRKLKEKFRCEIAGIIVHHLKPYRKDSCIIGRIKSNEDFNHLARKLTHFVMIKELKYCESVGQTLVVTESVKNKSREFIKKYMAKYGDEYIKPNNDPEFKDIPFTL